MFVNIALVVVEDEDEEEERRRRRTRGVCCHPGLSLWYLSAHAFDRRGTADTGEKEIASNYIRRAGQR